MKILFQVTKIEERMNNTTKEPFFSVSLLKEKKISEQGITSVAKMYVQFAVNSIVEGTKEIMFNSDTMEMYEREYVVEGVTKTSMHMKFKAS